MYRLALARSTLCARPRVLSAPCVRLYASKPNSEGHFDQKSSSPDQQSQARREGAQAARHSDSSSTVDAAADSSGSHSKLGTSGDKKDFQPGQEGEQIGGTGKSAGDGMGPTKSAKQGHNQKKGLHTSARNLTKNPRATKDDNVKGAQSPHLPHHNAGEGDKMPAVKNNAALPSHQSSSSGKAKKRHEPSWESTPDQNPILASSKKPSADYKHVKGTPEPDSHQRGYQTVSSANASGNLPHSSTSNDSPHPATRSHSTNEGGIGSSNKTTNQLDTGAEAAKMDKKGTKQPKEKGGFKDYTKPPDFRADDVGKERVGNSGGYKNE